MKSPVPRSLSGILTTAFAVCWVPHLVLAGAGNAASFNAGSHSHIVAASSPDLNVGGAITIETWIRPVAGGGEWTLVMGKQYNAADANPWYSYRFLAASAGPSEKGFPRRVSFNLALDSSGGEAGVVSSTIVPVDQWTHLAGTYDGATMKIYLNGELENSVAATGGIRASGLPLYLGKAPWTNYNNYNGQMDEVRVWNIARTAEQIRGSMNRRLAGDEDGLVAYWPFDDEPASPTTGDASGNGHTGTLYGGAAIVADSTAPIAAMPNDGLVSWWQAEDNATDRVGGNDGTAQGGVAYTSGKEGRGFLLDGNPGSGIVVPDAPALTIGGDVTVSVWFRRSRNGTPAQEHLLSKGAGSIGGIDVPSSYVLAIEPDDRISAGFERAGGSNEFLYGTTVTDGDLHHAVYVREGSSHRLYLDAGEVAATTFTGSPGDTAGIALALGGVRHEGQALDDPFAGYLDEVKIYDRALSPAEIDQLFGKTLPTVTTLDASAVTTESARLNLSYTPGDYLPEVRFSHRRSTDPTWIESIWVDDPGSPHGVTISGLESGTTYEFKAGLRFETGGIEGDVLTFATRALPTVTTGGIDEIGSSSVRSGGEVVDGGGAALAARGIVLATTPLPDLATGTVLPDVSAVIGTFSVLAEGLAPATRHYLRAYATNENGDTGYGEDRAFFTDTLLEPEPDWTLQLASRMMLPGETQRFFLTIDVPRAVIWSPGTTGLGLRLYDGDGDLLEETTGGDLERILLPGSYQVALSNPGGTPVDFTLSVDATQAVTAQPLVTVSPSTLVSRKLRKVTATARIGNAGPLPDVMQVGGTRGTRLFNVAYSAGGNVTAEVVAGLLETGILAEGDTPFLLTAVVTPAKRALLRRGVVLRRTFSLQVRAVSKTPPSVGHAGGIRVLTR